MKFLPECRPANETRGLTQARSVGLGVFPVHVELFATVIMTQLFRNSGLETSTGDAPPVKTQLFRNSGLEVSTEDAPPEREANDAMHYPGPNRQPRLEQIFAVFSKRPPFHAQS